VPLPPPTPATLLEPRAGEILVPPGEVVFGCAAHEKCPEQQRGRATYVEPFFLDRLEVTVLDYGKCVLDGACSDRRLQSANETADPRILSSDCNWHQARHERHALNCLSYAQAESYCRHKGSRLPTEAEWMRAARGDDGRAFPWGEERVSCERAVMKDGDGAGCGRHNSWQAGQKREDLSPFGVLDLAGNMREWVSDWYDPGYFAEAPQDNPPGPKSGRLRVIKGGSWGDHDPAELRVVARRGMDPTERSIYVGFRCARSAVAQ
jgi:iron(II)-dependent oxidoreductase